MASDLLDIARSGLDASKKAINTSSHNIANTNTEGYSRQKATQVARQPLGTGKLVFGTGADVSRINRVHSDFLERRFQSDLTENSFTDERVKQLKAIENIINEINSEGPMQILTKFFNSFRELSNNPENETLKSLVRENAKIFIKDIKRIKGYVDQTLRNMNFTLKDAVNDINRSTENIAALNLKILKLEVLDGETGDLRDKRDVELKNLAKYFKIHYYKGDKNKFSVSVDGIGTLVSGVAQIPLATIETKGEGPIAGVPVTKIVPKSYTKNIINIKDHGTIGAITKTRQEELHQLAEKINDMAWNVIHATNAIHRKGTNTATNETNIDFFKIPSSRNRAAEQIDLSDKVKEGLSNIVTGIGEKSFGDNRIALAISKIPDHRFLGADKNKTLEEDYLETIGKISLSTQKSILINEQTKSVLAQTQNLKDSLSGVSIDEETANLIKHQYVYDAAAKLMKIADELFKSVLAIKQ